MLKNHLLKWYREKIGCAVSLFYLIAGEVGQEDWFLFLVSEHWPTREIAPSVWMSLPVADGSGTHGMDGPRVLIANRHIELVCTYGGSDIYQPLGVIKWTT